jgi:F-type H+-transporting ATPase subunit delta
VAEAGKREALLELLESHAHPALVHFLLTLVAQREWYRLGAVAEAFFRRAGAARHGQTGELRTARELQTGDVARIEEALAERLGAPVHLHQRVDPQLLGGVAVRIGDEVFDGSVHGGLERIREALLA